jgi:hypothetical protein
MGNKVTPVNKKAKTQLLIARIFASVLAFLFVIIFVPKLIGEIIDAFDGKAFFDGWQGIVMEVTFFVFIAGYIVSWWKKCAGGIIIIIASLIQMLPFLIIEGNTGSLIFGVPLLVAGVLFVSLCISK